MRGFQRCWVPRPASASLHGTPQGPRAPCVHRTQWTQGNSGQTQPGSTASLLQPPVWLRGP